MKQDIHPTYYPEAKIVCACGNTFTVGSTRETLEVEICSACHPFYTGQEKVVDTMGRIQKFKTRVEKKQPTLKKKSQKRAEAKAKKEKTKAKKS